MTQDDADTSLLHHWFLGYPITDAEARRIRTICETEAPSETTERALKLKLDQIHAQFHSDQMTLIV